ncbi:MAG TPA: PEP/pyruvate-binding domain-containing protein, partial [Longilinea sp.]|nr:PEP/pyruvate-binding domain-containing protein [Longilinea sp.]
MSFTPTSSESLLSIYLALGQYPILSTRIRARMRRKLFERGIIDPQKLEADAREKAILSQKQEGLRNPFGEEPQEIWEQRLGRVRDQITDLLFSQHFSFEQFEQVVNEVLSERGVSDTDRVLAINPELAPQDLVFEQAMSIEHLPDAERARYEARLQELKVVLIRNLISDQLRYVKIAKEFFTIADLAEIRSRKIGRGRIGGKAAGMLLASRILKNLASDEVLSCLQAAESYFIGSDEMYNFMAINNLVHWNDQKYKSEDEMRSDYPRIVKAFEAGEFAPDILDNLQNMLHSVEGMPLIVRSSSLLEDNFGTSFAGKYDSIFLPNQGNKKQNLRALTRAIAAVYASTLNADALLYRRNKGLQDYDERMGLLIQVVQGERFGRYFFPMGAGVAFSRNLYRWAPQIRREDGFVRLVWGMGTRAVDRVGNDFPRLIALSHPLLRPSTDPRAIRRYSQQYIDLIDVEENKFKTLPAEQVLSSDYPPLRYLAQVEEEGYFVSLRSKVFDGEHQHLVLTFDELLRQTSFASRMRTILSILEKSYHTPVDVEFTISLKENQNNKPTLVLTILQCRPQSYMVETEQVQLPHDLAEKDVVLRT